MNRYDGLSKNEKQDIQRALTASGTFPEDLKQVTKSLGKDEKKK